MKGENDGIYGINKKILSSSIIVKHSLMKFIQYLC